MDTYTFGYINVNVNSSDISINLERNNTFLPNIVSIKDDEKFVIHMNKREYTLFRDIISSMIKNRIKNMEKNVDVC